MMAATSESANRQGMIRDVCMLGPPSSKFGPNRVAFGPECHEAGIEAGPGWYHATHSKLGVL
jgi:hypothetical protein